jgi:L-seryl-tRNA(Ser) seleniumtransferase
VDKLTLAALQATLLHYLKNQAVQKIPVWQMIAATRDALEQRANGWCARWQKFGLDAAVVDALSTVGGGSLPGESLPTRAVALTVPAPDDFVARLRADLVPIIARIENGRVLFDPRTVLPQDENAFLEGVERVSRLARNS